MQCGLGREFCCKSNSAPDDCGNSKFCCYFGLFGSESEKKGREDVGGKETAIETPTVDLIHV